MIVWAKKPDGALEMVSDKPHLRGIKLAVVKTELGTGVVVAMVMGKQLPGDWTDEDMAMRRCVSVVRSVFADAVSQVEFLSTRMVRHAQS
jgi:hypothetical protein